MVKLIKLFVELLLTSCFISFSWAVFRVFINPEKFMPIKMLCISSFSTVFFGWQLLSIYEFPAKNLILLAIGITFLSTSLSLFWRAIPHAKSANLGIAFSKTKSSEILVKGPYRYIRHPFYASYLLFWLGGVLVTQNYWLMISVATMGWFYLEAIYQEEYMLLSGEMAGIYKDYISKTGMLFPKVL